MKRAHRVARAAIVATANLLDGRALLLASASLLSRGSDFIEVETASECGRIHAAAETINDRAASPQGDRRRVG